MVSRISAKLVNKARLKAAETSAQPRTTAGNVIRHIRPIAVCSPIRANALSPRPISSANELLSGPRGIAQSHSMFDVPPSAAAHQATTMQNVATAIGKCAMQCSRSSQDWVWRSGLTIRFQTPTPGSEMR